MRVSHALVAIAALAALILIACGDGADDPDATSTLQPPTLTATTVAPLVDVPGRPNAFADYPGVVGIYLTVAGPGALGSPCLSELVSEWAMAEPDGAPLTPEERCLIGNTDTDADDEVVVLFTAESDDGFGLFSNVVVFDSTPDGYVAVFGSWTPDQFADFFPHGIVAAEDLTGDGSGELVYTTNTCGANTCTLSVHVTTGDGEGYSELTPEGGILMTTADLVIEDQDGDGAQELVLRGGLFGSAGAGPQREREEVYSWDGASFVLVSRTYGESDFLYFAIADADELFRQERYRESAEAYLAVVDDASLLASGPFEKENERAELSAYALYRGGLAHLALGNETLGLTSMQRALDLYPDTLNSGLADSFVSAYDVSEDLGIACAAVRDHVGATSDDTFDAFQLFWDFGFANPPFDAEVVCPF